MKCLFTVALTSWGLVLAASAALPADDQKDDGALTVIDGSGKEYKFKSYKFFTGTKHLSWLAPAPGEEKEKGKDKEKEKGKDKEKGKGKKVVPEVGPEALELTEGKSPPLKGKRVLSYIPLANIRSIDYAKKDTVAVRVVKSDKEADDEVLFGLTGYAGVNALIIDAAMELGELGTSTVKFQYGVNRGLQNVRFPAPRPIEPLPQGRLAMITQVAKNQQPFTAVDLQAVYLTRGLWQAFPILHFKDNIKLDLAKVQKLTKAGTSAIDFDVTLLSGQQSPMTLIERPKAPDGKSDMQIEGFVGRFESGYRFFPMATVKELEFDNKAK